MGKETVPSTTEKKPYPFATCQYTKVPVKDIFELLDIPDGKAIKTAVGMHDYQGRDFMGRVRRED